MSGPGAGKKRLTRDRVRIVSFCCLVLLLTAVSPVIGAQAAPQGHNDPPIVFAAGPGGTCHRDDPRGCDLYLGSLNLTNGTVSGIRLIAGGAGPQWFPALSPDGTHVAYEDGAGFGEKLVILSLITGQKRTIAVQARFPSFSADKKTVYYTKDQRAVFAWSYMNRSVTRVTTRSRASDAAEAGKFLVFHTRDGDGPAYPVVFDRETGQETAFPCRGCGHTAVSDDGTALAASTPDSAAVMVSRYDPATGGWTGFSRAADGSPGLAAAGPDVSGTVLFTYLDWAGTDRVAGTAMPVVRGKNSLYQSTSAKNAIISLTTGRVTLLRYGPGLPENCDSATPAVGLPGSPVTVNAPPANPPAGPGP